MARSVGAVLDARVQGAEAPVDLVAVKHFMVTTMAEGRVPRQRRVEVLLMMLLEN